MIATDGSRSPDERRIASAQQLVAALDGTFHSVVGEHVSAAVVDFAAGANATMIVVVVSRCCCAGPKGSCAAPRCGHR